MNNMHRRPGEIAAKIAGIATHLPDGVLTNEALAAAFPEWPADKILDKIGIRERRIAAPDETAADLAHAAIQKLFAQTQCAPESVDFLILCTQAPDYILPTTACVLQHRLGLPTHIGAIDVNLGCSGFVYALSLAAGLIAARAASRIVIATADTYSKYINDHDKSVRTLFGDGAAATLVEAVEDEGKESCIGPFVFGTDGAGAESLIVPAGGFRLPHSEATAIEQQDRTGSLRSADDLYMDGAAVMSFTLREVPRVMRELLEKSGTSIENYNHVVLHQANKFMLDALQKKLGLPDSKVPRRFEDIGNTVSSTIPFVLAGLMERDALETGAKIMVIGFGVGLSWAAAAITI